MKLVKASVCVFMVLSISGCATNSFTQNRDRAYLNAHSVPPLQIPPGISSDAFHTQYPVSDRQFSDAAKEVSIVPPGLNS